MEREKQLLLNNMKKAYILLIYIENKFYFQCKSLK